jgi:hypothetical protein
MLARAATVAVWAVLAASAVGWGLKLFVRGEPVPAAATRGAAGADAAAPARQRRGGAKRGA